jgi:hypothetical protein
MKRVFIIQPSPHPARENAVKAVWDAQVGQVVTIADPTRNIDQNAKFHALCGDLSKSGLEWGGKTRSQGEWKVLLVSGHAIATKEGAEVVAGLEGEYVNLRESTALMTKSRGSSLIEYTQAFIENNVKGE